MEMIGDKIKVLVIDDSEMVCRIFQQELNKDPQIEVVGAAPDPIVAREMIAFLKPNVLILDIEMPKMDGLTFLEQLGDAYPMPVIVVSSLVKEGSVEALRAMELGAAEVIAKPGPSFSVKEMCEQLIEKIKAVAALKRFQRFLAVTAPNRITPENPELLTSSNKIIVIGASTGGPQAITEILTRLPAGMPPILICQHMSPYFLSSFVERLNELCALEVKVADDKEPLTPGKALFAPGNKHMVLKKSQNGFYVETKEGPLVLHQRPSIEVLFRSVAMYAGPNAIGVILTGMGKDGAQGLLDMRNAGALTIAQDELSCAVFGLPNEAIEIGAVDTIVSLSDLPQMVVAKV